MKTIIAIILFVSVSFCQSVETENELLRQGFLNIEEYNQQNTPVNNKAVVTQNGNLNFASLNQVQTFSSQQMNYAEAWQSGAFNEVAISQEGSGNTSAAVQYGNNNSIDIEIEGDNNTTGYAQFGNNNNIEVNLNADNMIHGVLQLGNGNLVKQVDNSLNAPEIQIQQRGEGLKLIIENGSFLR